MEGLKLNKKNIYLMYLIIFLQSLVFYGSIATLYRQKRGLSMTEIFIIESAYFIIVIILEVPWGKLADKIGYKKIVVIANFIYFLSKIVFYNSGSFLGFLIEDMIIKLECLYYIILYMINRYAIRFFQNTIFIQL